MPIEDNSYKVLTLFPCSGLKGFRGKNHIYRVKEGHEKDEAIRNSTITMATIDEARARFQNAAIEVSGSHTICPECKEQELKKTK